MPLPGNNFQLLTNNDQSLIVNELSMLCDDGNLPYSAIKGVAARYNVNSMTISCISCHFYPTRLDFFSRKFFLSEILFTNSDDIAPTVEQL
jgi:hypothetical protein